MSFRNNGYGFQNTMSRIGAIIGPQIAFLVAKFSFFISKVQAQFWNKIWIALGILCSM